MGFFRLLHNKIIKFVILTTYLLVLCSGCMRDPFGRYPDSVEDASIYTKDVYYLGHNFEKQIVFEDIARIEASEVWQTFVDDDFNMLVTGRVLLKDENFDDFHIELISPPLDNEAYEFREINTDQGDPKQKKYIFQWNPSSSFLGDNLRRDISLEFRLTIVGKVSVSIFNSFRVFVYKRPIRIEPTVSIENPSLVFSGDTSKIKVTVIDRNATEDYPPVIDFVDIDEEYDAERISFSSKTQIDNYQWEFEYDFTAPLLEGDQTTYDYDLGVRAISRFGVPSPVIRKQVSVIKNMDILPEVSAPEEITMHTSNESNTESHIELQVENPFNGNLTVDRVISLNSSRIPGNVGHRLTNKDDTFDVTIRWSLPANTENVNISGEYELRVDMIYRWNHGGRSFNKRVSHTIKANIISIENSNDFQNTIIEPNL